MIKHLNNLPFNQGITGKKKTFRKTHQTSDEFPRNNILESENIITIYMSFFFL